MITEYSPHLEAAAQTLYEANADLQEYIKQLEQQIKN